MNKAITRETSLSWKDFETCLENKENSPASWKFLALPYSIDLGILGSRGLELMHRGKKTGYEYGFISKLNKSLRHEIDTTIFKGTNQEISVPIPPLFLENNENSQQERWLGFIHNHPIPSVPSPADIVNIMTLNNFIYAGIFTSMGHYLLLQTQDTTMKTQEEAYEWCINADTEMDIAGIEMLNQNPEFLDMADEDFEKINLHHERDFIARLCFDNKIGFYTADTTSTIFIRTEP